MDDDFLVILKNSKVMVKDIMEEKHIPMQLFKMMYLTYATMLIYYGTDMIYIFDKLFSNTDIKFVGSDLGEFIQKKYNLNDEQLDMINKHAPYVFYDPVCKISKNDISFNRCLYVGFDEYAPFSLVIRDFMHQMNHVLNSYGNYFINIGGENFSRMGICFDRLKDRRISGLKLEESLNKLETKDMLNCLTYISMINFNDEEISDDFEEFKNTLGYLEMGEEEDITTFLIKPLFENDEILGDLVNSRIFGNVDRLFKNFDDVVGNNSFQKLLMDFQFIDNDSYSENVQSMHESHAKKLIKKYNDKKIEN